MTPEQILKKHLLVLPDGNEEDFENAIETEPDAHKAVLDAMKEYAKEKCKEQRKLSEKSFIDGLDANSKSATPYIDMNLSLLNAPYPNFD